MTEPAPLLRPCDGPRGKTVGAGAGAGSGPRRPPPGRYAPNGMDEEADDSLRRKDAFIRIAIRSERGLFRDVLASEIVAAMPSVEIRDFDAGRVTGNAPAICIVDAGHGDHTSDQKRSFVSDCRRFHEECRLLAISSNPATGDEFDWLRAGAAGYLGSGSTPADLVAAVRLLAAGRVCMSDGLARRLLGKET
jgi:DNA-binding NarL/FixJ family response regulator